MCIANNTPLALFGTTSVDPFSVGRPHQTRNLLSFCFRFSSRLQLQWSPFVCVRVVRLFSVLLYPWNVGRELRWTSWRIWETFLCHPRSSRKGNHRVVCYHSSFCASSFIFIALSYCNLTSLQSDQEHVQFHLKVFTVSWCHSCDGQTSE